MKIFNKKSGFTFVEILLSVTISVIVLIFTFSFLADTIDNLATSDKKSRILSSLYDITSVVNNYKSIYLTGSMIVNNSTLSGSDILLLQDLDGGSAVIFGVIDKSIMKLETGSVYDYYGEKNFGYMEISSGQLTTVKATPSTLYTLDFTNSTFFDYPIKSFQGNYYNSGIVLDFDLDILINYNSGLNGLLWKDIPSTSYELFKINLNF